MTDIRSMTLSIVLALRFRADNLSSDDGGWRSWYREIADKIEKGELLLVEPTEENNNGRA